jgi:hypothetical protein
MLEERVAYVRRLWDEIGASGLEGAIALTEPDVEWVPHRAEGRVLRSDELLALLSELDGGRKVVEATPYSIEQHGDAVLASGSFRLEGANGISEFQIHWLYEFADRRLLRASSYANRSDALQAAGVS